MTCKNSVCTMLVLLCLCAYGVPGQMATGNIGGQVLDSSGAIVPNAKVTLVHVSTGQSRTLYTNKPDSPRALRILPTGLDSNRARSAARTRVSQRAAISLASRRARRWCSGSVF